MWAHAGGRGAREVPHIPERRLKTSCPSRGPGSNDGEGTCGKRGAAPAGLVEVSHMAVRAGPHEIDPAGSASVDPLPGHCATCRQLLGLLC
ncbi:hypothetical protein NDU88_001030 [Pleurodeles waltl]|uniref:Uncharacterized protein n=1 Tax=Pleurodeles waltl TaxID=8319 RepID=A0AAV7NBF2_PLEWA|nr:hypothetical protein NDU88_001030 [Pleurodeles waltl]